VVQTPWADVQARQQDPRMDSQCEVNALENVGFVPEFGSTRSSAEKLSSLVSRICPGRSSIRGPSVKVPGSFFSGDFRNMFSYSYRFLEDKAWQKVTAIEG